MFIFDDLLLGIPLFASAWRALSRARIGDAAAHSFHIGSDVGAYGAGMQGSILNVRGLSKQTPAARAALLQASADLGIPVDSLAAVISSESGWDSTAMNPLPAAGLIQITTGARLPGFDTADAVRAVGSMPAEDQFEHVVVPYYRRFGSKVQGADAGHLYMLNFLPAVAGMSEGTVLGVRPDGFHGKPAGQGPNGELPTSALPNSSLSLGTIYSQNFGFDHEGKGYFTIGDVYAHVQKIIDAAHGQRIDVDGTVHDGTKTVGGCGDHGDPRVPTYKSVGGPGFDGFDGTDPYAGVEDPTRTVGGCSTWEFEGDCLNVGQFKPAMPAPVYNVKVVGGAGFYEPYMQPMTDSGAHMTVGGWEIAGPGVDAAAFIGSATPDGTPPGFENAREVFDEPDAEAASFAPSEGLVVGGSDPRFDASAQNIAAGVPGYAVDPRHVGGPGGVGWGETYDPNDPFRQTKHVGGGVTMTPEQADTIKKGVVAAVRDGENDPISWTQVQIKGPDGTTYDLMLTNEPVAVKGLRLPTSMDDAVAVGKLIGSLPITPAIAEARWANAEHVHAKPLGDKTGALDYRAPGGAEQVVRYNAAIGPNTGRFRDGAWKEIVLVPGLQPQGRGSMAQYGFRDTDSHMFEHGGPSNHDKNYADYSDTPTYAGQNVLVTPPNGEAYLANLADLYASGGPLGGPLPAWLVEKLRSGGGEVGA